MWQDLASNNARVARKRPNVSIWLLAASVAVNIGLAVELRGLRHPAPIPPPFHLAPPIQLEGADGQNITVPYHDSLPTFIYWFSPTCGWCERNYKNFETLGREGSKKYRFFAVSAAPQDQLKAYAIRHGLNFPLYTLTVRSQKQYQFRDTPTSMLLSGRGELLNTWKGAYGPTAIREIGEELSLRLPEVIFAGAKRH
jgi:hypothetical protein